MKIEEIQNQPLAAEIELINKIGTLVAAGKSSASDESQTKVFEAQYPDGRSSATDHVDDSRVQDLYENGLLFTAIEYKGRTTPEMTDMRGQMQKQIQDAYGEAKQIINKVRGKKTASKDKTASVIKNPVCQILLPRSKSDNDIISHKFNDVGESLITKGGGTATGVLSSVASTAVFGAIESATNGIMADHGEQIYNTARSMYAGAENRSKTYTWELTPRTEGDLVQIIRIYELFSYLSYGVTGKSEYAKEIKSQIDEWYKNTFINKIADDGKERKTMMESVTSFLSNVIVVSNPTVWFIQNFGTITNFDKTADLFGPAQIQSIRFDKSPDGNFNGLSIAPNLPSTFVLEITFREILTLNRGSLYGRDVL